MYRDEILPKAIPVGISWKITNLKKFKCHILRTCDEPVAYKFYLATSTRWRSA